MATRDFPGAADRRARGEHLGRAQHRDRRGRAGLGRVHGRRLPPGPGMARGFRGGPRGRRPAGRDLRRRGQDPVRARARRRALSPARRDRRREPLRARLAAPVRQALRGQPRRHALDCVHQGGLARGRRLPGARVRRRGPRVQPGGPTRRSRRRARAGCGRPLAAAPDLERKRPHVPRLRARVGRNAAHSRAIWSAPSHGARRPSSCFRGEPWAASLSWPGGPPTSACPCGARTATAFRPPTGGGSHS